MSNDSTKTYGTLTNYQTGDDLRSATRDEMIASYFGEADFAGTGAFDCDGTTCYVSGASADALRVTDEWASAHAAGRDGADADAETYEGDWFDFGDAPEDCHCFFVGPGWPEAARDAFLAGYAERAREIVSVHTLSCGDRVEGGTPGTEDYDTGTVLDVAGNGDVTIAWASEVRTTVSPSTVRLID